MSNDQFFSDFLALLHKNADAVETLLDRILSPALPEGEINRPPRLLAAMRHGVLNGGKRLRPFLVMESAALFDAPRQPALHVAAALECIQCYSLIHDDLPAMDNDDLRRGKPTVHKAFDEATAILAGDALQTLAFDILADDANALPAQTRARLVLALARACGVGGLCGGQMLDIAAEKEKPDEQGIITMQAMKTGSLLRFACEAGAIVANAPGEDCARLAEFGTAIGLAYQLADDLLDITAEPAVVGKTLRKDVSASKATLIALHGGEWVRRQLDGLVQQANDILHPYGDKADILRQAARFIACRNY